MTEHDVVFVCSEPTADGLGSWCGLELERRYGESEGVTLWMCPIHGQRGVFMNCGTLDLSEFGV